MVYSDDKDFALKKNYDSWDDFHTVKTFPTKKKLTEDRIAANSIINRWIGTEGTDVTDEVYLPYLKQLEVEVILRMHDKGKDRKAGESKGMYTPHDYIYQAERDYLVGIGYNLGHRRRRGVSA